ncbi:hypothetical protein PIB30_096163 [Stylosanthes scabra]|uniref:Uncharacterized protein n=1 Tax=Stylosanthes scabra TaxID=79078 RepID=A0ABU6XV09_9FABA|nr:hypothetical protein [Stylosanthes scabra]
MVKNRVSIADPGNTEVATVHHNENWVEGIDTQVSNMEEYVEASNQLIIDAGRPPDPNMEVRDILVPMETEEANRMPIEQLTKGVDFTTPNSGILKDTEMQSN